MEQKRNDRAVFFDLDGTLCDTLADLTASLNYALRMFDERTCSEEQVRSFIGNGLKKQIERALPDADGQRRAAVQSIARAHYEKHCTDHTAPYAGMPETLERLRRRGYRLAVITNKPHGAAVKILETLFPAGTFDRIAGHRDGAPLKPDPALYFAAADSLGVLPAKTVYVGDSDVDLMFAAAAGADAIGCGWGFRGAAFLKECGAKVILARPAQLLEVLQ